MLYPKFGLYLPLSSILAFIFDEWAHEKEFKIQDCLFKFGIDQIIQVLRKLNFSFSYAFYAVAL